MKQYHTEITNFFADNKPSALIEKFGSPLYVYNEAILRERAREMAHLTAYPYFKSNYSAKANSNLRLLQIIKEEGLHADAMSPGEIHVLLAAGFNPEDLFFVANNVSAEEMKYAIDKGVLISCDSLSQLRQFGRINPGGEVAIRFNPGVGAGHHEKVITGGNNTKFGVNIDSIGEVKNTLKEYNLRLKGINQHIGSLFMEATPYIESVKTSLRIAEEFEEVEFVDMGGGFGIPYRKQEGQARLDIKEMRQRLTEVLENWASAHDRPIQVKMEPGRYVVAECGIVLGTVHAVKENGGRRYVGTDIGFNVLARPVMYDSHHDIEIYRDDIILKNGASGPAAIVGNICETGDIIAKERDIPLVTEGDLIGIMDAGAYGYSMASNYNNRLRPAEILIGLDGRSELIRRRDSFEDLLRGFPV